MTGPVLELRHVSKAFRGQSWLRRAAVVPAVQDVSLAIAPGEIVALVGMSGAGKSTVGRMVLGLERPDSGEVLFEGNDLARLPERTLRLLRRRMHLIFQDPYEALHPGMRIADAVAEPLVIAGVARQRRTARVHEALAEVDLTPVERFRHRYPHELSGGQRQRVALARALVERPRLVVADEPTSMLDVSLRACILELIARMRAHYGISFLFVTHDLAVARYVSDRIAVMDGGRLVEVGSSETLINEPQHPYTRSLLAASEGAL
ncbi:MAG: dipeptide ABC transporter ATP-binding protein [Herpetosiphon sp.]